ncbi:MAG: hypothetical protein HYX76_14075 [Acidobacteria bacterium]|nr:hypothetical protein [Acidobacteriota bacterium]
MSKDYDWMYRDRSDSPEGTTDFDPRDSDSRDDERSDRDGGRITDAHGMGQGFDTDRSFMLIEVAGDQMFFQTVSRTGNVVDSGVVLRREVATEGRN